MDDKIFTEGQWPRSRNVRQAKQSVPTICKFGHVSATAVSAAFQIIATRRGGSGKQKPPVKSLRPIEEIARDPWLSRLIAAGRKLSPKKLQLAVRFLEMLSPPLSA
jgi:hypothetical protein